MFNATTRRAYVFAKQGKPSEVLSQFAPIEIGTINKDEVLVHLKAAALNPLGYKMITVLPRFFVKQFPCIPEMDFSGVIVRVGSNVEDHKVGDEVVGVVAPWMNGEGALTEYVKAEKTNVIPKPTNLTWEQAAGLGVCGMTVVSALTEKSQVKKGDRVFVNGGSGGVGVIGVQLARYLVGPEGTVVSSCSAANIDFVKGLGADEVVDYRSVDLPQYLRGKYSSQPFDIIFDTIGVLPLFLNCASYLKPEGKFVNVGVQEPGLKQMINHAFRTKLPSFLGGVPRNYEWFMLEPSYERFKMLGQLAQDGHFKAIVDSTYSLPNRTQMLAAYERIMSGRARGKVVLVNDEKSAAPAP